MIFKPILIKKCEKMDALPDDGGCLVFQSAIVRDVRDIIQNRARSTMEDVMDDAMIKKNRIQGIRFIYVVKGG